jgi:arylsulfatase A-like enzyme
MITPPLVFRLLPVLACFCLVKANLQADPVRPNVLIIVADGIEVEEIEEASSPNLHRLRASSDRFVDFHLHPVPAMWRASLLTGRPAVLSGVVGDQSGENLLPAREFTIAEAALRSGYRTAFFGSWGLGDFAPFRPEDQGFLQILTHGGSHLGSFADAWGNRGTNDLLRRDGNLERFIGHSNDVWFDALLADLENDPETPALWWIAPDFSAPVSEKDESPDAKRRWLDRRLGEVLDRLEASGRRDTTLLALIAKPPVALERSPMFEEGHRASLWLRYPAREVGHGRDIAGLAADVDLLPTLAQLSPLALHGGPPVHGKDLTHRLRLEPIGDHLADRAIVFATVRDSSVPHWQDVCVMRGSLRRLHLKDERGSSTEFLYDLSTDPGQRTDLIAPSSKRLPADRELRDHFFEWWRHNSEHLNEKTAVPVGEPGQATVRLDASARLDLKQPFPKNQQITNLDRNYGHWNIDPWTAGPYRLVFSQIPGEPIRGTQLSYGISGGPWRETRVTPGATEVSVEVDLLPGSQNLQAFFSRDEDGNNEQTDALFVEVTRQDQVEDSPGLGRLLLEETKGWSANGDLKSQSTEDELILSSTTRGSLRSLRDYREFTFRFSYRVAHGSAALGFALPPGLVPLPVDDAGWHRFELAARGGRAVAFRDGKEVARFESLPGAIGKLEFTLETEAGPAALSLRDLEIFEYREMERLTSWIGELGFGKGFQGDFVRISLPYTKELPDGSQKPLFHYGFLHEEAADRSKARIFHLDGFESEVTSEPPGRDPVRSPGVSWQAASLKDHGKRWLESDWPISSYDRFDQPPVDRTRMLDTPSYAIVLAAALRERGETDLSRALFEKAWRALVKEPRDRNFPALRTHLAESLASVRFGAAVQENGRPEVPRSVVSAQLEELIDQFPGTEASVQAAAMCEDLQATCELRDESFLDEEALAKLASEDRIAEWIRQLETQRGGQFMSKAPCDPFLDPRGAESPAARLAAIGRTAVPRLIATMDDTRLTRSPAHNGYTLRVGEVAVEIIERIATKSFSSSPETMISGGHGAAKAGVLAWWDSVKDIDQVAERTLAIRSGGPEIRHHAASLYEEIGPEALPVIFEAVRATTDPGLRGQLVTIAARGGLERSSEFLREEMRNGPGIASRVRAAAALDRLGEGEEALDLMIAEWRKRRDAGFPDDPEERGPLGYASMFLIGHPSPEALAALTEGWTDLPLGIRSRILSGWTDDWPLVGENQNELLSLPIQNTTGAQLPGMFGSYGFPGSFSIGNLQRDGSVSGQGFTFITPNDTSMPVANRKILEEVLYQSLEETGRRFDVNSLSGSHSRLCDDAAKILTKLHPDRLVFAVDGSWRQRELDRFTILNQWLEERGERQETLPPMPDTPPKTVAGTVASISVEIPAGAPASLRELLTSTNAWKGSAPNLDNLLKFARRAVAALPGGWELRLRLDGDPALFRGLHLGIEVKPFNLALHRRDVGALDPDRIWTFFRTEAGGGIKTYSRQDRFNSKDPIVLDPESGKLENFDAFEDALGDLEEPLALTLRQAETHAIFFEMALRRAPRVE